MKKFKLTGEKIVNLCLLLLSAFYLAYSLTNYKIGTLRQPKEGFLPLIIGVGGVCVSAFLTVQSWLDKGDAAQVRFNISWPRFGLMVAVSLAYALLMDTLGYTLSSFLFLMAVLKLAKVEGWLKITLISLICALAFYFLFKVALGVMLPGGFLGF